MIFHLNSISVRKIVINIHNSFSVWLAALDEHTTMNFCFNNTYSLVCIVSQVLLSDPKDRAVVVRILNYDSFHAEKLD